MQFVIYEDNSGAYRWRALARGGRTVAVSGGVFTSERDALRAAEDVKSGAGAARVGRELASGSANTTGMAPRRR
jgi:uncharacterized protein YegP (UPF0339 family)